nr:hypothetical protein [Tanacetum cinerariifolium]
MQTQTSNTLHNAIIEAGSKDCPPMLAPGNYVHWKSRIKRYIDTKPNHELIHYCLENPPYRLDWKDVEVPVSEGSPITTTGFVKLTRMLKQGESINVQDLETNLYWEFGKFTSQDGESLESYYSRIGNVAGARARETVGSSVVQKSRIQCYDCKEFKHVARECQKPKRAKDAAYHREKMLLCKQEEARIQLNAEQADWRDDTDDDELEDQELEAHYMYMTQLQKVSNDDHYNVFAMESTHPEQSKSVHDTYPIEQDAQNVIIDSLDMNYDREEIDQNDDDNDLAKERELLASLIEKLKCEIDESKNRNKFLETSNNDLIEKLKGDIEDFKNKNKSLESSNNFFKEANNKLSETNNLLYADYKKSEAKLARRNIKEYASQMELECAKISFLHIKKPSPYFQNRKRLR